MKVEQIMSRHVKVVGIESTLADAARIMWENDCGCVPVVDDRGRLAGVLTDRDICMAAYLAGRPLMDLPIRRSMSGRPIACRPNDSIADAEKTMQDAQIRRLPVTTREGELLGVLSLNDVARAAARANKDGTDLSLGEVGFTLSAVSQPRQPRRRASSL
jgi:CBS domain-containing protein